MQGELHPTKNRLRGGLAMGDISERIDLFPGAPETAKDKLCNRLVGAYDVPVYIIQAGLTSTFGFTHVRSAEERYKNG